MNEKTELCDIAFKYKCDKCPEIKHFYTRHYYKMFNPIRNEVKKVLEIGIGHKDTIRDSDREYVTGASLFMWRDFFPNAQIYGVDIEPKCIFQDERIETSILDQSNEQQLTDLIKRIGSDIDIVIDDGSHRPAHQVFTCRILMPLLKKDVIYVIEDVKSSKYCLYGLRRFDVEVVDNFRRGHRDDRLLIVSNK